MTTALFANSLAVVIGIDSYAQGIPALRTAANDARRIAQTLAEFHGYQVISLLDEDATRERITALLSRELPARVGPDDRVLFYWAGHGMALDGDTGPNGYLLPVDAKRDDAGSFLHMPFVHDALLGLSCRHMLIVLDSCFSGAFRWSGTCDFGMADEIVHQEKYDRYVHDPAWQVLTSASQDERALDQLATGTLGTRDGDGAHSPFALALLQGIEGAADVMGGRDGDGLVTAQELYLYLDETLQSAAIEVGTRQTPGLWPLRRHGKGQFVFFVPDRELALPPAPPLTYENNPWRGLASYERGDAALFFGRDKAIENLTRAVVEHPFTVVVGASGSGKSSLVKAGTFARLGADSSWCILPDLRPGDSPMAAIADAVASIAPDGKRPTGPEAVLSVVTEWCTAHPAERLVLMVDQIEELVTMTRTQAERDAFLELIARLLDRNGDRLRVVLTLRTDYEPHFDRTALHDYWRQGRHVIPPMSRGDLQAVIEEPATKRVLYFDPPQLVDALLDEVTNMPGGLPLLSFALSEMYVRYVQRRASDRALSREDYDALGGVVGALRSRADEEYDALEPADQQTMQRMMLRMVGGGSGNLARRRVHDDEITFPSAEENARVERVRQRLVAARLLVEGKDAEGDPYIEPAHDALVRAWGRLAQWIQQAGSDAVPLVTRQKLAIEAADWKRAKDKATRDGLLWRDRVRSAMLSPVVQSRAPWLNSTELEFARRSVRDRWLGQAVRYGLTALAAVSALVSVSLWRGSEKTLADLKEANHVADSTQHVADSTQQVVEENHREIDASHAARDAARDSAIMASGQRAAAFLVRDSALTDALASAAAARQSASAADSARRRAESEKRRAVRSLFSSFRIQLSQARPGSVCTRPECGAPTVDASQPWMVLGRIPDDVPVTQAAGSPPVTRDFVAAREFGAGHVLVYAHEGITNDAEIRAIHQADNLTFAENAFRWLTPTTRPEGCPPQTTIVLWPGYVYPQASQEVFAFIARRGWTLVLTGPAKLARDLECAGVFWFGNDWEVPPDFGARHVPQIEAFVRRGGGLLVGGLGWSWRGNDRGVPYPGNVLGQPFGFRFTRDYFDADKTKPIPLTGGPG